MNLRWVSITLAAIAVIGALAWRMSAQGPVDAASTPAPGGASGNGVPAREASVPSVALQPTLPTPSDAGVPPETAPEAAPTSGPMRLEEDLPDLQSGGVLREPEEASTVPSSSAQRAPLPESLPSPDDGRPLRGPETTLPGLPPAADPALLPDRPPEDQGATSTR